MQKNMRPLKEWTLWAWPISILRGPGRSPRNAEHNPFSTPRIFWTGSSGTGHLVFRTPETRAALREFNALPSTRVLLETDLNHGRSFPAFALARSQANRQALLARPLSAAAAVRYEQAAIDSHRAQREREAADDVPFETFRQQYLAQDLMGGEHFRPAGN